MSVRANRQRLLAALAGGYLPIDLRRRLLLATRRGQLDFALGGRVLTPLEQRDQILRSLADWAPGSQSDKVELIAEQWQIFCIAIQLPTVAQIHELHSMRFPFADYCAKLHRLDAPVPHSRSQLHRILSGDRSAA
jgi:hypothetical protein